MIKAIIFDKDGVLVDSEPIQYESTKLILAQYGHEYSVEDNKNLSLGRSGTHTYNAIAEKYGIQDIEIFIQKRREKYIKLANIKLKMRNGALAFIKKVSALNYNLAVASGSSEVILKHDLIKFKLQKYFSVVISGEHYKSKPDPEIFLVTARKLKVNPNQCIVIEDSQVGVEAAKAAGMYCFAIPNDFTNYQDFSKADCICNTFNSIYEKIVVGHKTS